MVKRVSGLVRNPRGAAVLVLFSALASGCLDTPQPALVAGAAQGVEVAIEPPTATVVTGGQQLFAAAVIGTADIAVTWHIQEAGCGTVTAGGVYTAPSSAATCHVVVTSRADPSKSAAAVVTVQAAPPPVTVAVSPSTVTVAASGQTTFTATVTGSTDTAVTWLVQEANCGTVTAGGVYTAPAAAATCHVVATSHADPGRTASSTVTVTGPPPPVSVSVSVSPDSTSVFGCQTATFSATVTGTSNTAVTWSVAEAGGGTVSAAGVYTAPSTDGTYHVVATSAAAPTASASAAVVVTSRILSVTVSPATVTTTCGSTTALTMLQAPAAGGTTY